MFVQSWAVLIVDDDETVECAANCNGITMPHCLLLLKPLEAYVAVLVVGRVMPFTLSVADMHVNYILGLHKRIYEMKELPQHS